MQKEIASFGEDKSAQFAKNMTPRSISIAQDETFFRNKPCLVGTELISNYILLEKMAADRKTATWNEAMKGALNGLPVNVIQSTSDECVSLLKHTKESLGAAHSPDLFHVAQDIGRSGSAALKVKEKSCRKELDTVTEKRIKKAIKVNSSSAKTFEKETEKQRLEKLEKEEQQALQKLYQAQQKTGEFNEGRRAVGLNYHPYDLQNGLRQSPEKVESLLTKNMLQCKNSIVDLGENAHAKLAKAMRLIPSMKATLIFYFTMTAKKLDELNFDFTARGLIEDELMPAAYLKIVAKKEKNKRKSESLLALANEKSVTLSDEVAPIHVTLNKR